MGYLNPEQRACVIAWLKRQNAWNLAELRTYIEQTYAVVFESRQSYYTLIPFLSRQASVGRKPKNGIRRQIRCWWRKKHEISAWLEAHQDEINAGELVIFFEDECHLVWGDVCGYVWGKTDECIEVPMTNERCKQTYDGAVTICTQQCLIQALEAGKSENTIAFLEYLRAQCPHRRIALI